MTERGDSKPKTRSITNLAFFIAKCAWLMVMITLSAFLARRVDMILGASVMILGLIGVGLGIAIGWKERANTAISEATAPEETPEFSRA